MNILKKEAYYLSGDENLSLIKKVLHNKIYRTLLSVIGGAILGFLYWRFVGCNSGTCPLTSNPYQTTLIGGVLGGLVVSDNKKNKK